MWLIFNHQQFISYSVDLNWLLFFLVLRSLHVVFNIPWLQQFFHFLTHNQTQMAQHTPFIYKEDKDRKSFNHGGLSSIIIQWSHYITRPPSRVSSNGVFNLLIMNRTVIYKSDKICTKRFRLEVVIRISKTHIWIIFSVITKSLFIIRWITIISRQLPHVW